jgi:transcriptional regulator with XRE-family HTH domain
MNVALTIQQKLKDLRVEHGLTLEQLEQRTGISKSALGDYETEDCKDISHSSIVTLAKLCGVSADCLLKSEKINTRSNRLPCHLSSCLMSPETLMRQW